MTVTPEFKEASTRAAIRALRGLEQTAIMLETYAPEIFPEVKVTNGVEQKTFGRVMMESAAQAIRDAWKSAIVEAEAFTAEPSNWIEERAAYRQALLEIAGETGAAIGQSIPSDDQIIIGHIAEAARIAKAALKSNLV